MHDSMLVETMHDIRKHHTSANRFEQKNNALPFSKDPFFIEQQPLENKYKTPENHHITNAVT